MQGSRDLIAPKAGIIWTPWADTHLRAYYTRSIGGVYFDNSVRLEPTQIAGFNQVYRSLIPESVVGIVPGTRFEAWGAGIDRTFKTGTYIGLEGEMRNSQAERVAGIFTNSTGFPIPDSPSATRQALDYEEKVLTLSLNQLISREWSLGARYQLTDANLNGQFVDIPASAIGASALNQDDTAILHQLNLFVVYNHPCGFFSQFDTVWTKQSNLGYTPDIPGEDFWQFNAYMGYRFAHRRAEFKIGLMNITGQDYRLNPLSLYAELPRERTFATSFKFYF
jgi:hypothetical protein